VTGYLVRPYDVEEMARRIDHLLGHPEVAHALGARGRERVERNFTEERHVEGLLGIYRGLGGGQGWRDG